MTPEEIAEEKADATSDVVYASMQLRLAAERMRETTKTLRTMYLSCIVSFGVLPLLWFALVMVLKEAQP